MRANVRTRGEQKNKQPGRQEAQAHQRLPRKGKVRVGRSANGEIWMDLPDERGFQFVSPDEMEYS